VALEDRVGEVEGLRGVGEVRAVHGARGAVEVAGPAGGQRQRRAARGEPLGERRADPARRARHEAD
jgi:hypothetical protein